MADTEQQWLELAQGKTVRQLEELVAGKHPGDAPSATPLPSAARHVLRFEVAPETFALFREALALLRRQSNQALDDDSALLSMARQILGGPTDDGRASYQIALNVCPTCGIGQQQASGELVTVGADLVAMAQCDAQHLGHLPSRAANENAVANGEDAHVGTPPSEGASTTRPTRSREGHPAAQVRSAALHVGTRAKQTVPPALRRTVLRRDQQRCRVPGCRNATFVDVHHIQLRSERGRNEPANLLTVCGAHHRAAHRGQLLIEHDAHTGVRVRHADGTQYGHPLQPNALDMRAKLFSALRGLGFREREVRAVLEVLREDHRLHDATIECLLREALRRIQLSPGAAMTKSPLPRS